MTGLNRTFKSELHQLILGLDKVKEARKLSEGMKGSSAETMTKNLKKMDHLQNEGYAQVDKFFKKISDTEHHIENEEGLINSELAKLNSLVHALSIKSNQLLGIEKGVRSSFADLKSQRDNLGQSKIDSNHIFLVHNSAKSLQNNLDLAQTEEWDVFHNLEQMEKTIVELKKHLTREVN